MLIALGLLCIRLQCGGCGEKGECLVEIKECNCLEGYQGLHCEHSPEAIQSLHDVTPNILQRKFIFKLYIYIYIHTCIHIYIYIYRNKEDPGERGSEDIIQRGGW